MTEHRNSTPTWERPRLVRLGKLADVAGGTGLVNQSGGTNKS